MHQQVHLRNGTNVNQWRVRKRIGKGFFSTVYQVSDPSGVSYALKAEGNLARFQLLKMEVCVLQELQKANSCHFARIVDKGRQPTFHYIVTTLFGKNLEDLLKSRFVGHFSMGTAIGVAYKTLEALEDFHSVGYIHRDVKPSNFAIGRPERNDLRSIYVLDFGISRKFVRPGGEIRRPRRVCNFRGTTRYASVSCHKQQELSPKDDVESWIYMAIDFTTGTLPWKNLVDVAAVGSCKQQHLVEPDINVLVRGCAPEMKEIIELTSACAYYDMPNYDHIYCLLRGSFSSTKAKEYPYDWELPDPYFFIRAAQQSAAAKSAPPVRTSCSNKRTVVQELPRCVLLDAQAFDNEVKFPAKADADVSISDRREKFMKPPYAVDRPAEKSGPKIGQMSGQKIGQMSGPKFGQMSGQKIGQMSGPKIGQIHGPKIGQMSGPNIGPIAKPQNMVQLSFPPLQK